MSVLTWDEGPPLAAALRVTRNDAEGVYIIAGALEHGETTVPLDAVQLLLDEGIAVTRAEILPVEPGGLMPWLHQLLERGVLKVPLGESARLREALLASGASDLRDLPDELRTAVIDVTPVPHLVLRSPRQEARLLQADVLFSYDGGPPQPASTVPLAPTRDPEVMARRIPAVERRAHERLRALGARAAWNAWDRRHIVQVPAADVPRFVRLLVGEGWHVEADGRRYRLATTGPRLDVSSGVDWFEVHGGAEFGNQRASLPQLLDAIRRRQGTVLLDDGTYGILPEHWMREFAPLALGSRSGDRVRFASSQMALLDALLAERPAVSWDAAAAKARDRLRAFEDIPPADPPATFIGTLRDYQREGLGWLHFLQRFGFGGCLADDMGLGKTVRCSRCSTARADRGEDGQRFGPSLVVVPRSLVFNWKQEAARFTPELRVLDYTGAGPRQATRSHSPTTTSS